MDAATFRKAYGVSRETCERLETFAALLTRWTKRINLIAPKTLDTLWSRHIADSAQLWTLRPDACDTWLDLGSGGGLPGLVIAAIAAEETRIQITLVESDGRKSAFLATAAREMNLSPTIVTERIESLRLPKSSVISARALAPLPKLLELAAPHAAPETVFLFPKGRNARSELTEAQRHWHIEQTEIASRTEADATILKITRAERRHDP
ncbi:MAG: 16S rRNA (guanine(527)-N(7))-methyltransferase RsmG [Pseudomonadota bacterium]